MDDKNELKFEVLAEEAGERLDVMLARRLNLSRSQARKRAEQANINGSGAKASQVLKANDQISLTALQDKTVSDSAQTVLPVAHFDLPPVLYEDEHLFVFDKPRGLVVHPGAGTDAATLVDILRAREIPLSTIGGPERAGVVHRLDKETSGAIIICKTDDAHLKLAADFKARRVQKNYAALVCGVPPERGRIEAPIARHARNRQKMAVSVVGKMAVTEYSVVRSWQKFALLDVRILTGRTHQIRVHLAHLHHPIVGDARYGGLKRAIQAARDENVRRAIEALQGQALHAAKLEFHHPVSGEILVIEAPLPDDMQRVLDALDAA